MYNFVLFVQKEGTLRRFAWFCLYWLKELWKVLRLVDIVMCCQLPSRLPSKMKDSSPQPLKGLMADGPPLATALGADCLSGGEPLAEGHACPFVGGPHPGVIHTGQLPGGQL